MQIALQLAITFARIARLDYPGQWPTLVADVMSRVAAGPLAARRAYLVLHHVLKELASKRLPADQRNFAKVLTYSSSPEFLAFLLAKVATSSQQCRMLIDTRVPETAEAW